MKDYELYLGRRLVVHSVTLPDGDRLVTDADDSETRILIEAKASSGRKDVRMALGQLLDYSCFLAPSPRLAILLPDRPTTDLLDLLGSYQVSVIVRDASGFVVVTS